jgi:Uma2 family endonuclease
MVTTAIPTVETAIETAIATPVVDANKSHLAVISLEEFLENPPDRAEWINNQIITKAEMTAKTGRIQAKLARYWGNYKDSGGLGGEVYTETACRTVGRVRCPDVAYLPPDQVAEFGDFKVLPHSFSLIAEVISPTDIAEEVFTKVREYLESNGQEIWLLFPESQWLMIITAASQQLFGMDDTITSPLVLPGLTVVVGELMG